MPGPIALVGGNEFREPARELDTWLLERSATKTVTVLPTANARSRPDLSVQYARAYFKELGAQVRDVMVLDRTDADDEGYADEVKRAKFLYLTGGDPRLLAETLRDTAVWSAIVDANEKGALLAGSSAGAMALCEKMLVPRHEGLVDGLGLLPRTIVVAHHNQWRSEPEPPPGFRVIGIDECTGYVIDGDETRTLGAGSVKIYP